MPRRTHQIPARVGQEIPKCRCGAVPRAEPLLPTLPTTVPAFTRCPGLTLTVCKWEP